MLTINYTRFLNLWENEVSDVVIYLIDLLIFFLIDLGYFRSFSWGFI